MSLPSMLRRLGPTGRRPAPPPRERAPRRGTIFAVAPRQRWGWGIVDAVALLGLAALVAVAWYPAFGVAGEPVALMGGCVVGLAAAALAAWRRFGWLLTTAVAWLAYLLTGSALAMPSLATARVLPNSRTIVELLVAPVTVWRGVLTIDPPIGETGSLLAAPLLVGLIVGLVGLTVGLRSGRPGWAWLAPAAGLVAAIAFGAPAAHLPLVVGLGFFAIVVVWVAYRRRAVGRVLLGGRGARIAWSRVGVGALVLALAGGVAALAAPALAPTGRSVLRNVVEPPLDVRSYPSPLQGFRANLSLHKTDVLLHVDHLPEGARIRVATLDAYDGMVMGVANSTASGAGSGTFRRVGERVPVTQPGRAATVTVRVEGYAGVWLPTVGNTTRFAFAGDRGRDLADALYFNPASGTALTTRGLTRGDAVTTDVTIPSAPRLQELATAGAGPATLPRPLQVPDVVAELATRWTAGAQGSGDALVKLEQRLRQGYYSNGLADQATSAAGHSSARIATLLAGQRPMIGDEEQYSVAMVLIARAMGIPARVVYGYAPRGSGSVDVTGADVSAWVEAQLDGLGWVSFNPTPDHNRVYTDEDPPQENRPRPQVENPPPPPNRPDQVPPDNTQPQQPTKDNNAFVINWALVLRLALIVGLPLLLIVVPIATILGLKARRRNARGRASGAPARFAGGWAELLNTARDLGARVSRGDTRGEQADFLLTAFPGLAERADPRRLARSADAAVFSSDDVDPAATEQYWVDVSAARAGLLHSIGRWRRLRGAVSVRSLLPQRSRSSSRAGDW